ncbi:hypothetical protein BT96DRAFT_918446 [Gymnopus androsaceus JB14]|uniref:Uncharacterized protein n=1 Tax=Gymnopus androsaceus JB14 TaxID=1447944 RepID=A0A6A4HUH6_9AGAR|nr:hypothetical protein BT96DRAFT_918446 [Gymnopus androsaceus JB14]
MIGIKTAWPGDMMTRSLIHHLLIGQACEEELRPVLRKCVPYMQAEDTFKAFPAARIVDSLILQFVVSWISA